MDANYDHNLRVLRELEPGDLVQIPQMFYTHWGVYVGDENIVHMATGGNTGTSSMFRPRHVMGVCGKMFDKARVCKSNFWKLVGKKKAYKKNIKDGKRSPRSPREIVEAALGKVGEVRYNLLYLNCEHFAMWCRYGTPESDQAKILVMSVVALAIVVVTVLIGVALSGVSVG